MLRNGFYYAPILLGILLQIFVYIYQASEIGFLAIGLCLWSSVPFLLLLILRNKADLKWFGSLSASLLLMFYLFAFYNVFYLSSSSTSAISLMFIPVFPTGYVLVMLFICLIFIPKFIKFANLDKAKF